MFRKSFISLVVMVGFVLPASTFAATTCDTLTPCGNGNPENVTNVWGGTNSTVPHVQPGQSVTDQWGFVSTCPAWFSTYCVDISHTQYYISRH